MSENQKPQKLRTVLYLLWVIATLPIWGPAQILFWIAEPVYDFVHEKIMMPVMPKRVWYFWQRKPKRRP